MNKFRVIISIGTHNNIIIPKIEADNKKHALELALEIIKEDKSLRGRLPHLPEQFCQVTQIN